MTPSKARAQRAVDLGFEEEVVALFKSMHANLAGSREKSGQLERTHFMLGLKELLVVYKHAHDVINNEALE